MLTALFKFANKLIDFLDCTDRCNSMIYVDIAVIDIIKYKAHKVDSATTSRTNAPRIRICEVLVKFGYQYFRYYIKHWFGKFKLVSDHADWYNAKIVR